jgi:SAM-dependent methyltransferase
VPDIASLRAFYLDKINGKQTIFHIWDDGGAFGDSVTPSTYSGPYRVWMRDLLRKFLDESVDEGGSPALLSVGCGNAVIEAELVATGYRVLAVDALQEAVSLAKEKGVEAICADVLAWTPPRTDWSVVYADGLLGHLYDPAEGVQHVLSRLRSWMPRSNGVLVISNDGPRTNTDVESHPDVPGFAWMSGSYLHAQAEAAGFRDVWTTWFSYERPLSGSRDRVVVTARA